MTEFSRRVNVEVFKDDPLTREEFLDWAEIDPEKVTKDFMDKSYDRYLHYHQPYWWHAQSPNGELLTNGEHYANEAGAINSITILFGDDTTMYWMPMYGEDRSEKLLRYGVTDREHQAAQS